VSPGKTLEKVLGTHHLQLILLILVMNVEPNSSVEVQHMCQRTAFGMKKTAVSGVSVGAKGAHFNRFFGFLQVP
jgi:hypothetical protein